MIKSQTHPGAKVFAALGLALGVAISVVGCSAERPTPSAASTTGETSTAAAQNMVDVSQVWATHPLPPCPRLIGGNLTAPAGLELPSDDSVAKALEGVSSPASESWVRSKLGWLTMWLALSRAGIIDHPESPSVHATVTRFGQYVAHVKSELEAGQDISDAALDGRFPEGCI